MSRQPYHMIEGDKMKLKTGVLLGLCMLMGNLNTPSYALEENNTADAKATVASISNKELMLETATLLRSARAVISDNQALINDPEKGDKGLTADMVIETAIKKYQEKTGHPLPVFESGSLAAQAQKAMLESVREVVNQAQPLINEQGKGFKGFIPAVFTKQVGAAFSARMEGKMFLRLTAPKEFIRNRANRSDEWEEKVIEQKFKLADWPKSKEFEEQSSYKGAAAYRLALPEYYVESCLKCHGDPKGDLDITGAPKEGGRLGDLGAVISIGIYTA